MQHRPRLTALLLVLIATVLAVCVNSQTLSGTAARPQANGAYHFAPDTRVVVFRAGVGQWSISTFRQAKPDSEFYSNDQFYRISGAQEARVVPLVTAAKLFEADRPCDVTSRRPGSGDVVQILGADTQPVSHALFEAVQPSAMIRFQGKAYTVSSKGVATVFSTATSALQHIEVTTSSWQHITNRHTVGGTQNAGASIWLPGVDIRAMIKNAELITPIPEPNGYVSREFDAGRPIGYEGRKQTSTYKVIATQSGKLVTAYPIVVR